MIRILLNLLIISILGGSCKKDDNGSGGSGGTYMSYSAGNQWNYERDSSGTTSTYSLTATDNLETKSGRQYHIFNVSTGGDEYYANSGSQYFSWSDLGLPGAQFENLYLKDNLAANEQWDAGTVNLSIDTTFSGIQASIAATIKFRKTIVANNTSIIINSNNYDSVIHTQTTPEVVSVSFSILGNNIAGTTLDLSSSYLQSYYGKRFGLISDTTLLSGVLTIPIIPLLTTSPTVVPLDSIINTKKRLMSANF